MSAPSSEGERDKVTFLPLRRAAQDSPPMNSSAPDLFDVQGLVAVITGGGTGTRIAADRVLSPRR
jgi:hypothetical protein